MTLLLFKWDWVDKQEGAETANQAGNESKKIGAFIKTKKLKKGINGDKYNQANAEERSSRIRKRSEGNK